MLAAMAKPEIRIVSLTVTEGGYYISPATQSFDPAHPDIAADIANFAAPKTAFGLIAAALKRRRDAGVKPFTVMSCDNIPGNGHVTENAVVGLAELVDAELAAWIKQHVAFPNSMVDRITPATSERERNLLRDQWGVEDAWPVFCEEFKQWVIEDHFCNGRPQLEKVGVTFTQDVAPYELMKIRILNGGHAAIAYPAALLDIHFVHESMEDAQIAAFLAHLTKTEIMPTVPPPPATDLEDYRELIARRFANPKIGDTITQALPRRLQPAAEVHPADGAGAARSGRERDRAGVGLGFVVPLLLRRHRERQADRAQRRQLGPPPGARQARQGRREGLSGDDRHLRRQRS